MRPVLNILNETLIEHILGEAHALLEKVGVEVQHASLHRKLLDHSLKSDPATGRILFPTEVVERAVQQTPPTFILYNRDGVRHTNLGEGVTHFTPGSSGIYILDHRTGKRRRARTRDFVEYVHLADGLPDIAFPATAFSTDDIEPLVADAWRLYLVLTNTRKPVTTGAFTKHGVPRMAKMMEIFRADQKDLIERPMSIFTITPLGGFRYGEDSCQNLLDCLEWGIPIEIAPVTNMGLTAPVTLLKAAAFHTADVLAGVTMAQILKPGAPILFGGAPAAFDMRTATSPMAAVEATLLDTAYFEVGKHLGLPTQAYMAFSDSKFLDAQAGAETFGGALLAALSGADVVSGPGMLDYLLTFSLSKLVFDSEICGQVLHFAREDAAVIEESTSAVELARSLLEKGHLLTADHTLKHWRQEWHLPGKVIDRDNWEKWRAEGKKVLEQRAADEVEARLAAYEPLETDSKVNTELRRLIRSGVEGEHSLPDIPPP